MMIRPPIIARLPDAPFEGKVILTQSRGSLQPRAAAARGLYRIFNAVGYRFYRSNSAPPLETDSPFASNATLPYQPATTFADGTWYLSMSYFNGVLDSGFLPLGPRGETYLIVEILAGALVAVRPGPPVSPGLIQLTGGIVQVVGYYLGTPDGANRATQWAIAYTIDGSTPPTSTPTITPTMPAGPLALLAYSLPAQSVGVTVKVQLQVRRGSAYSLPATVLSTTIVAGPSAPLSVGD